ncbi:2608_t:CDS:2, partial [Gigaspora rosea]
EWIETAKKKGYKIIVMRDFNFDCWKAKMKTPRIFIGMKSYGLHSMLEHFGIENNTWTGPTVSSQIDDIWSTIAVLVKCDKPRLICADEITNSDHKIIMAQWNYDYNLNTKQRPHSSRWVYEYDKMKEKNWKEFETRIERAIKKSTYLKIKNQTNLDKIWNKLANDINTASKNLIPRTKIVSKTHYEFSTRATKLHSDKYKNQQNKQVSRTEYNKDNERWCRRQKHGRNTMKTKRIPESYKKSKTA